MKTILLLFISLPLVGCQTVTAYNRKEADIAQIEAQAPAGTASIRLQASEQAIVANFAISVEPEACKDFKDVGQALSALRRFPIYRDKRDIVEVVPAGRPVQIRGFYYVNDNVRKTWCGPVVQQFVPRDGAKYTAQFDHQQGRCTVTVVEGLDLAQQLVPTTPLRCKRTFLENF